jgi:hypothetical protein
LAGSGIQIGQRFIKQEDFHWIHQNPDQGNPLFLTPGKVLRSLGKLGSDMETSPAASSTRWCISSKGMQSFSATNAISSPAVNPTN